MKTIILKKISFVFTLLVLSVAMLPLTSCGSEDDKDEPVSNDASLLIGTWYQSATWTEKGGYKEETIDRKNWYISLTFEKNGIARTEIREYDESASSTATYTYNT